MYTIKGPNAPIIKNVPVNVFGFILLQLSTPGAALGTWYTEKEKSGIGHPGFSDS